MQAAGRGTARCTGRHGHCHRSARRRYNALIGGSLDVGAVEVALKAVEDLLRDNVSPTRSTSAERAAMERCLGARSGRTAWSSSLRTHPSAGQSLLVLALRSCSAFVDFRVLWSRSRSPCVFRFTLLMTGCTSTSFVRRDERGEQEVL